MSAVCSNVWEFHNTATGFIGGFTGKFITDTLEKKRLRLHFVQVSEDTRINVKIKADQKQKSMERVRPSDQSNLEELKAILSGLTAARYSGVCRIK